jgi:hypothetical protein
MQDLIRIQKRTARRLFNAGLSITVCPNKYNVYNEFWCCKDTINKSETDLSFDQFINAFEYYNCNNELGRYTAFYTEKSVYDLFKKS